MCKWFHEKIRAGIISLHIIFVMRILAGLFFLNFLLFWMRFHISPFSHTPQ
nr:MAG TPA: hypothetical protein [Caudoviricetes sp.]